MGSESNDAQATHALVELLRTQADIYEYLAAGHGEDSDGVRLAQRYTALQNLVNSTLQHSSSPSFEFTFNPLPGEQLLETISSKL